MFQRRHYEAIAATIREVQKRAGFNPSDGDRRSYLEARYMLVMPFCDMLARDNPNFDQERFLKACGFTE